MRFDLRRSAISGVLFLGSLSLGSVELRAQADPCSFFPDSPTVETKAPNCTASYWIRVGTKTFGGLHEYGAVINIQALASTAAAQTQMAKFRVNPPARAVANGNGGIEKAEEAGANDFRTPSPDEIAKKEMEGDLRDLTDARAYSLVFRCGQYIVSVSANPSKGPAARQLASELEGNLVTQKICDGGGSATVTTPTVPVGPTTPPVTPPTVTDDNPGGGGARSFDGNTAREIMNAQANGSRYMVVLSREWDPSQQCYIEDRAWVSNVRGSSGASVVAVVGPTTSLCVRGAVLDQATVNQTEAKVQNYRNQLAKALAKKEEFEALLKDPKYATWAAGEIAKVDAYINTYTNYINQAQSALNASIPRQ